MCRSSKIGFTVSNWEIVSELIWTRRNAMLSISNIPSTMVCNPTPHPTLCVNLIISFTGKLSRGLYGIVTTRRLTKTSPRRNILTPFYGVKIEGDDKVMDMKPPLADPYRVIGIPLAIDIAYSRPVREIHGHGSIYPKITRKCEKRPCFSTLYIYSTQEEFCVYTPMSMDLSHQSRVGNIHDLSPKKINPQW